MRRKVWAVDAAPDTHDSKGIVSDYPDRLTNSAETTDGFLASVPLRQEPKAWAFVRLRILAHSGVNRRASCDRCKSGEDEMPSRGGSPSNGDDLHALLPQAIQLHIVGVVIGDELVHHGDGSDVGGRHRADLA